MSTLQSTTHSGEVATFSFNPDLLEFPMEIENVLLTNALNVGPFIRADSTSISCLSAADTDEEHYALLGLMGALDGLRRVQNQKSGDRDLSKALQFTLNKRGMMRSLLIELQRNLEACKQAGLGISFNCTQDLIEVHDEYGSHLKEGWLSTLIIEASSN